MTAFLPAAATAAAAVLSSVLANKGTKTTTQKPQKFQKETIDQLLAGLQGSGPLANLFSSSPEAFQTSVSDPLLQQFNQQTAPGIQQGFISQGQQRGTPLESALSRGGLDVQSEINKLFLPFLQGQQNRSLSGIQALLGFGAPALTSSPTALGAGAAGAASSGQIPNLISSISNLFNSGQSSSLARGPEVNQNIPLGIPREGFAR